MELFSIRELPPANPSNDRGQRTWNWEPVPGRFIAIYRRRKGELFGGHFHKGDDAAKNPELFLLISGKMRFKFTATNGGVTEKVLNASQNLVELVIQPWVLHEVEALEDCSYIEYRGQSKFDPADPDTYPESEFVRRST